MNVFEKLKTFAKTVFSHNIVFINSLVSFYKEKKITETCLEFLIQSIQFKAKKTESTGG